MNLTDPGTLAFLTLVLAPVCAGAVQATRATRVDSRWLPLISGAWGLVVAFLASYVPSTPLSGVPLGGVLLIGLMIGFGATGVVTVATHFGAGSTDGTSTAARP